MEHNFYIMQIKYSKIPKGVGYICEATKEYAATGGAERPTAKYYLRLFTIRGSFFDVTWLSSSAFKEFKKASKFLFKFTEEPYLEAKKYTGLYL